jgi:hypothetical protein
VWENITGEWKRLHQEKLYAFYFSSNIVRLIKSRLSWVEHVARIGERKGAYGILVRNPERKRQFGKPKLKWEDNIKMDL